MSHPLSAVVARRRGGGGKRKASTVWSMIKAIPEPDVREAVANHSAQWFAAHGGPSLNPSLWCSATGGKLTGDTRVRR